MRNGPILWRCVDGARVGHLRCCQANGCTVRRVNREARGGIVVVLRQGRREITRTQTDSRGHFAMANIPAGLYQVDVGSTRTVYRIWTIESAPPGASQQAVLVSSPDQIVRGNHIESAVDQLDAITLALVTTSIASLVVASVTLDKVNHLESSSGSSSGSPASP